MCLQEIEHVVGAVADEHVLLGEAVAVAVEAGDELTQRGGLGVGVEAEFLAEVERLTTRWAASRLTSVRWCHPKLTVRVKYLATGKVLRHSTLKRFALP